MRISLIGMSGSGKSHWSAMLAGLGFTRHCCDDLIARKLSADLTKPDGTVLTLGEWMGFPFERGYSEKEARYLSCEKEVLHDIIDRIGRFGDSSGGTENVVVDTTGSVIYTGKGILKSLREVTRMVHFESPPEAMEKMLREYLARPRPVLWQGLFHIAPGESTGEALARCYQDLLESREMLYRELADFQISWEMRNSPDFGVAQLLEAAGEKQ